MEFLNLAFVVFACLWTIAVISRGYKFLSKTRHRHQAYTLFEVRDRLYWLAVDSKLQTRSESFQFIEGYLNRAVHFTSQMNVDRLIEVLFEQDDDQEKINEFVARVSQEPEEVSQVIIDVFRATRKIIVENSPFVTWACRNSHLRGIGRLLLHYKLGRYLGLRMMQKVVRVIENLSQIEYELESHRKNGPSVLATGGA